MLLLRPFGSRQFRIDPSDFATGTMLFIQFVCPATGSIMPELNNLTALGGCCTGWASGLSSVWYLPPDSVPMPLNTSSNSKPCLFQFRITASYIISHVGVLTSSYCGAFTLAWTCGAQIKAGGVATWYSMRPTCCIVVLPRIRYPRVSVTWHVGICGCLLLVWMVIVHAPIFAVGDSPYPNICTGVGISLLSPNNDLCMHKDITLHSTSVSISHST